MLFCAQVLYLDFCFSFTGKKSDTAYGIKASPGVKQFTR